MATTVEKTLRLIETVNDQYRVKDEKNRNIDLDKLPERRARIRTQQRLKALGCEIVKMFDVVNSDSFSGSEFSPQEKGIDTSADVFLGPFVTEYTDKSGRARKFAPDFAWAIWKLPPDLAEARLTRGVASSAIGSTSISGGSFEVEFIEPTAPLQQQPK